MTGYNYQPELTLANGRMVGSTKEWNMLTFALVMNRESIYTFIVKTLNFNLQRLLDLDNQYS